MEQLELLMGGFASALTPINLLWVLIGALLGTAVGVLPGLGSAMAVALLLPGDFFTGTDRSLHHVRRHLLRRPLRRLHLRNPAQHSRPLLGHRVHVRGTPDGQERTGGQSAGHLRHRSLHRRPYRHHPGGLLRPHPGQNGNRLRTGRVLRPGSIRLPRHLRRRLRISDPRHRGPRNRPRPGPRRH